MTVVDDASYAKFVDALKELTDIGNSLGRATTEIEIEPHHPMVLSMTLYTRAWTNFRGVQLLWKSGLTLEAEIILRSLIETAICLANLDLRRDDFIKELAEDASSTMHGQINMMRKAKYGFAEVVARDYQDWLATKGVRLDLERLAEQAKVPDLYSYHRVLSGVAVHISGVSVGRHSPFSGDDEAVKEIEAMAALDRRRIVLWTIPAMLTASMAHAHIIENADHAALVGALSAKLVPEVEQYAAENGIEILAEE